jgi:hypothetical protein
MVVGDPPISRNPQDTREEEIDRGADQGQMSPTGQVGVIKHGWMGTPPINNGKITGQYWKVMGHT